MSNTSRISHVVSLALFAFGLSILSAEEVDRNEPVEGAPVFFAKDLLGKERCEGEGYMVRPLVALSNFEYVFKIESDYGSFTAYGTEGVDRLAKELEAIGHLKRVSQTEAFATTLANSFREPIQVTVGVARRPISTVAGLPSGIGRYLQGKFYEVRRGSSKALGRMSKSKKDDPDALEETDESSKKRSIGSSTRKLGRKHLGYDSSKRSWAQALGVDPYSSNEVLQEELGRIAWASSIGGFAGDFAVPASEVVSYAGKAQQVVWDKSPITVERDNIKTLKKLSFPKDLIKEFTETDSLSLSEKTYIVLALDSMSNSEGLEEILELSMSVESERDALVIARTLEILRNYTEKAAPISRLTVDGGKIVAHSKSGYLILPLAVDYLHWTPLIAHALESESYDQEKREIWVSGTVSSIARDMLSARGWFTFEDCLN